MWTSRDDLTLLQQLAAVEVVDEEEVEWEEMCEGWDSARSPYFLRVRWSALRREVPNYRLMTFQGQPIQYLMFSQPQWKWPAPITAVCMLPGAYERREGASNYRTC